MKLLKRAETTSFPAPSVRPCSVRILSFFSHTLIVSHPLRLGPTRTLGQSETCPRCVYYVFLVFLFQDTRGRERGTARYLVAHQEFQPLPEAPAPRSFTWSISFEMSKIDEYSFVCGSRQVRLATGEFYGLTVSSLLHIITIWSSFPSQTLSLSVSLFNPPHPPLFSPSLTQEHVVDLLFLALSVRSSSFCCPHRRPPPFPLQLLGCLRLRLGPALRRHFHLGPCPHTQTHTHPLLAGCSCLCPCLCFLP